MRKKTPYLSAAVVLLALAAVALGIERGSTRAELIDELGEPVGMIASGDYELFSYDRGNVELREGVVVKFDLMTSEELVAFKRAEQIRRAEAERRADEERRQRYERGLELKQQMLNSPTYAEASGARKLEILRQFHGRYPEVEIDKLLLPALREKKRAEEEAAEAEQLARLERRVDEAELRAQQAEWRAMRAESNTQDALRTRYYNQSFYSSRYDHYYRPHGFGLSVGYESPNVHMRYSRDYHLPRRTMIVTPYQRRTTLHEVAPKRIRSTSSTVRFNDGL